MITSDLKPVQSSKFIFITWHWRRFHNFATFDAKLGAHSYLRYFNTNATLDLINDLVKIHPELDLNYGTIYLQSLNTNDKEKRNITCIFQKMVNFILKQSEPLIWKSSNSNCLFSKTNPTYNITFRNNPPTRADEKLRKW